MKIVYKYRLTRGVTNIVIKGYLLKVVMLRVIDNVPTIWVEHQPGEQEQRYRIEIFGTGRNITDPHMTHIGSWIDEDDNTVWHAYMRANA